MDLDSLFNDLRTYNGQTVTLRLDTLTLACTIVNVAQAGSADVPQLELNVQLQDLDRETYQDLQRLIGQPVDFRLGALTGKLGLDAVSQLPADDKAFKDATEKPFVFTFSAPEAIDDDIAYSDVEHDELHAGLRAAGFSGFAERLRRIDIRVRRQGRTKIGSAVNKLRTLGKYALAERLEHIAEGLYGPVRAIPDLRPLVRRALVGTSLEGNEDRIQEALDAFQKSLEEKEALGPSLPPDRVKAPMTVSKKPKVPFPVKDVT